MLNLAWLASVARSRNEREDANMRLWLAQVIWWFKKWFDKRRPLSGRQSDQIVGYHTAAMNIFRTLDIDVGSKPQDVSRRYHMMLVYLDRGEIICPAAARTAMLINFLDSLKDGWVLPPASIAVSKRIADEVDGYMAVEISRNHLGI